MIEEKLLQTLEYGALRELVAGYCQSLLGKRVAEKMLPYESLEKALRAQQQVAEMIDYLVGRKPIPMHGAQDAMALIEDALEQNKAIDPEGLNHVRALLTCAKTLRALLWEPVLETRELKALLEKIPDLEEYEEELKRTVDGGGEVLSTASPRLAAVRSKKEQLMSEIRRKAESYLSDRNTGRYLQEFHVSLRNGRMVLPVRVEHRGKVKGILHGYSATGNTVFIEPQQLVEAQDLLEKRKSQESREIARILWERTRTLIDLREEIRAAQRVVAWLDFTQAGALYAMHYGLTRPDLRAEPIMNLRQGRHPILMSLSFNRRPGEVDEKRTAAFEEVIPLDIHLGDHFDILVITGPNTGGKTAALKTAGLISLMAASGLQVPAGEGSVVPFYLRLLADIGDEQDLTQNLSTFSSHMQRISHILHEADQSSLVLLDELGTGTDPLEGEALGRAILKYLLQSGAKVLVSTHLSMLKEFAFSSPRVENACMEFDPDTLSPTFQLRIGMPGESNAIRIAKRLGLPDKIVQDAQEALSEASAEGREDKLKKLMDAVQRVRIQNEETLGESQRDAQEAEKLRREAEAHKREVAFKKSVLEQEAEREIDEYLRRSWNRAVPFLQKLKNVPAAHKESVEALEEALLQMMHRSPLAKKRKTYVENLKKGDLVYIPRYRERCRVLKIKKKDQSIEVAYRNLSVKVPMEEVMWPHWY